MDSCHHKFSLSIDRLLIIGENFAKEFFLPVFFKISVIQSRAGPCTIPASAPLTEIRIHFSLMIVCIT